MKKPRPYSGPVDFAERAEEYAETWPDATLLAVVAVFPYPPERGVRHQDWVELVAHVALRKGDDPTSTAERLALYVTAYQETHQKLLSINTVKESQT